MTRVKGTKQLPREVVDKILACKGYIKYKSIPVILGMEKELEYHTVWRVINMRKNQRK